MEEEVEEERKLLTEPFRSPRATTFLSVNEDDEGKEEEEEEEEEDEDEEEDSKEERRGE